MKSRDEDRTKSRNQCILQIDDQGAYRISDLNEISSHQGSLLSVIKSQGKLV